MSRAAKWVLAYLPAPPLAKSPFPIHRREALESLNDGLKLYTTGPLHDRLKMMQLSLSDQTVSSILLPINGIFLDRNLPLSVRLDNVRLPFERFVLEYSISEDWYIHAKRGNKLPCTILLLVQLSPNKSELQLWSISQEKLQGVTVKDLNSITTALQNAARGTLHKVIDTTAEFWSVSPVGVSFARDSSIATDAQGRVLIANANVLQMPADTAIADELARSAVLDYSHEIQALIQLLTLCAHDNSRMQQVDAPADAPGKYFVMRSVGRTPYQWLPNVADTMQAS
jgi:hypothetical protein